MEISRGKGGELSMLLTRGAWAMNRFALATLAAIAAAGPASAQPAKRLADRDIVEAYQYMLGRLLVLRQENRDFKEGFKWNEIIHRATGGVDCAKHNLEVLYSDIWHAIDNKCTMLIVL